MAQLVGDGETLPYAPLARINDYYGKDFIVYE
jgi:hypothetical protein